jgi:hypothetical protein
LVVDLTGCKVSSDGMAVLLGFHRRTRDEVPVTLVVRDSYLLRMLEIVGLTTKLGTYPTITPLSAPGPSRHDMNTERTLDVRAGLGGSS